MPVPNYCTYTKTILLKKCVSERFLWSNPYNIEVIITSLIEVLKSSNFVTKKLYNINWVTRGNFIAEVVYKNYDVLTFILKYFKFKKD